jgi:SAM-dependent methyltransferase
MDTDARWLDSMPGIYDDRLGPALFAPFAEDMARRVAGLAPGHVLETAAGTGVLTRAVRAAVPGAEIVATDLNGAMVDWAAARTPGVRWQQADAQALPLPDAAVDVVVCQFGVMFFPDRPAAFAEAARVLVPGGTLVFSVWDTIEHCAFAAALVDALAAVLPERTPDFVARVPHGYADPGRITADLAAAGLAPQQVDTVRLTGSAPSARALAEGFCLGTPLRFALADRGPLPQLTGVVAEEMTARLGEGPVTGPLTALVVTARSAA